MTEWSESEFSLFAKSNAGKDRDHLPESEEKAG
jgi:hypothetical protein